MREGAFVFFLIFLGWPASLLAGSDGPVLDISKKEREYIDSMLGAGVLGKAVPSSALEAEGYFHWVAAGDWTFHGTGGDIKGKTLTVKTSNLTRDRYTGWRVALTDKHALFARQHDDGSLLIISEQDAKQGVMTKFSPPEPMVPRGLKPGESKKLTIEVKVYDLGDPSDLTHQGHLNVTLQHLGHFATKVPAGQYNAALLKWTYEGKVGPAKI